MRRALCLLAIFTAVRAWGQDFASRFMADFPEDTLVQCRTISPKMMERLIQVHEGKEHTEAGKQHIHYFLSKLKSARIITGSRKGETYYRHAEELMARNKNRFSPLMGATDAPPEPGKALYVRKRQDVIVELVMLRLDVGQNVFNAVNFTGEMDDEFIQLLSSDENQSE